jgi:SAM-dependent methyltransferase
LDIGCGTGLNSLNASQFGTVSSLDSSQVALDFCGENGLNNLYLGVADNLPFPSATFDLVFALDVLEHVENDQAAAQEILRVLKPGGVFIGFVPAFSFLWSSHDEYLMHHRRYRSRTFKALFGQGWEHLKVSYFNTILFPPVALVRLLSRWEKSPYKDPFGQPSWLNALLYGIFRFELFLLPFCNFPFGISLLGVFRKK